MKKAHFSDKHVMLYGNEHYGREGKKKEEREVATAVL